jgi:hypothetical protein
MVSPNAQAPHHHTQKLAPFPQPFDHTSVKSGESITLTQNIFHPLSFFLLSPLVPSSRRPIIRFSLCSSCRKPSISFNTCSRRSLRRTTSRWRFILGSSLAKRSTSSWERLRPRRASSSRGNCVALASCSERHQRVSVDRHLQCNRICSAAQRPRTDQQSW